MASPARLLFACLVLALLATSDSKRVRVVLDTDIGTDFDDTMALIFLLASSDTVDLKLIQVSTFNTTQRAQIVAKILHDVGRMDVPLAVGRYTGEQQMPQYAYASQFSLASFVHAGGNLTYGTAILQSLMSSATPSDPLFVIEIAPATSLGDALSALSASGSANVVTVAMSGSIYVGYANSSTISPEYNVVTDVTASQLMYNATWLSPLATAPLDTTVFQQWGGALWQAFVAKGNNSAHVLARTLLANYAAWYAGGGAQYYALKPFSPSVGTSTMYDPQAAWMALYYAQQLRSHSHSHSLAAFAPSFPWTLSPRLAVLVNDTGYTVVSPSAKPVFAAVGFLEAAYDATASIGSEILKAILTAG